MRLSKEEINTEFYNFVLLINKTNIKGDMWLPIYIYIYIYICLPPSIVFHIE